MSEKPRVLIVDDERAIAQAIGIRLRSCGYEVIYAVNGQEGLLTATSQQPAAIILDMRMPVMDGMEALGQLKQQDETRHIPVIMVSASLIDKPVALRGRENSQRPRGFPADPAAEGRLSTAE